MKKLVIFFLFVFSVGAWAQKNDVKNAELYLSKGDLAKAKERLDSGMRFAEVQLWTRTYSAYGDYYFALYNGSKSLSDLMLAVKNYQKSLELDTTGKNRKFIERNLDQIWQDLINLGVAGFNEKNYENALNAFDYSLKVKSFPKYASFAPDSMIFYNAGLAAYNAQKYTESNKFLSEAAKLGYERRNSLILIKQSYLVEKDTIKAIETLKTLYSYYPAESDIIVELISMFLLNNQNAAALEYIEVGKKNDPNNSILLYAEGILYEQNKEFDKAVLAYDKALSVKPDYFNAAYNAGVIQYNRAAAKIDEANKLPISAEAEYKIKIQESDAFFKLALPYLEKALTINGTDRNTLISLKEIYYRLKMTDKFEEVKAKLQ